MRYFFYKYLLVSWLIVHLKAAIFQTLMASSPLPMAQGRHVMPKFGCQSLSGVDLHN